MTCIIGLKHGNKVYMGGDACASSAYHARAIANPKVFTKGDMLFGFCGSLRLGQLLQTKFDIPRHEVGVETYFYITNIFVEAVRQMLKDVGFSRVNDNVEESNESEFLLAYNGRLFCVQQDFSAIEYVDGVAAIGSGEEYALGAIRLAKGSPARRIEQALESAAYYDPGVSAPFTIISGEWEADE